MLWLMLLVVAPGAWAQVNIEKLRSFDVDGIAGSVTGDISLLSGNSEAVNVGVGARFDYRRGKRYIFLIGNVRYGESRNRKYRERSFSHLRYNYDFTKRLVGEVFGQIDRDALTLLQIRLLGGGGLRYRFFLQEHIDLFLGSSLMAEFEDLEEKKAGDHPATVNVARWSNYLNLRLVLTDKTFLINTLYVQFRLDAFDDVRLLNEAALGVALNEHLMLRTTFNLRYDSRPPGEVKQLDLLLVNGLTVTF